MFWGSVLTVGSATVKVSSDEFNDNETGAILFTCKQQGGVSDYQEFIDARKAEIGAGDAQ